MKDYPRYYIPLIGNGWLYVKIEDKRSIRIFYEDGVIRGYGWDEEYFMADYGRCLREVREEEVALI